MTVITHDNAAHRFTTQADGHLAYVEYETGAVSYTHLDVYKRQPMLSWPSRYRLSSTLLKRAAASISTRLCTIRSVGVHGAGSNRRPE